MGTIYLDPTGYSADGDGYKWADYGYYKIDEQIRQPTTPSSDMIVAGTSDDYERQSYTLSNTTLPALYYVSSITMWAYGKITATGDSPWGELSGNTEQNLNFTTTLGWHSVSWSAGVWLDTQTKVNAVECSINSKNNVTLNINCWEIYLECTTTLIPTVPDDVSAFGTQVMNWTTGNVDFTRGSASGATNYVYNYSLNGGGYIYWQLSLTNPIPWNYSAGTTIRLRVKGRNSTGDSVNWTYSSTMGPYNVPAAPAVFDIDSFSWTTGDATFNRGNSSGSGITSYDWDIYYSGSWHPLYNGLSDANQTYAVSSGILYQCRVRAYNILGYGSYRTASSHTYYVPANPYSLGHDGSPCYDGSAQLTWTGGAEDTSCQNNRFYIYRSSTELGSYSVDGAYTTDPVVTRAVTESVTNTWWYKIRAWNILGYGSSYSNIVSVEFIFSLIKEVMGVPRANIKEIDGVPIADVKEFNGVA